VQTICPNALKNGSRKNFFTAIFNFRSMKNHRTSFNAACFPATNQLAQTSGRGQKELRDDDWLGLLRLAYTDREKAFKRYSDYYLSTNGQTYCRIQVS